MAEAERCDRLGLMHGGRLIDVASPAQMKLSVEEQGRRPAPTRLRRAGCRSPGALRAGGFVASRASRPAYSRALPGCRSDTEVPRGVARASWYPPERHPGTQYLDRRRIPVFIASRLSSANTPGKLPHESAPRAGGRPEGRFARFSATGSTCRSPSSCRRCS